MWSYATRHPVGGDVLDQVPRYTISSRPKERPALPARQKQILCNQKEFNMKNACHTVALVFFMSLASSGALFAQSDLGRISGFVKDPSGATVANAKVTVQSRTGVERQTATNESGYYIITNVPPGFYTMTAEAPGFQKYQKIGRASCRERG